MISVELDLFSGRVNESWELTNVEAEEFVSVLTQDLAVVRPLLSVPPVLGYRGYIVRLSGVHETILGSLGVPNVFRITDLPLDTSYLSVPLDAGSPGDSESVVDGGEDSTDISASQSRAAASLAAACILAYTSWNDFSFWNGTRKPTNNCYCYAANYATNNWSLPGRRGGNPITTAASYSSRPTDAQFTAALLADKWKTSCSGSSLKISAWVGKVTFGGSIVGWDYHFYRKSLNGSTVRWCHKPGGTAATNKDSSGSYITNPATANRVSSGGGYVINYNENIGMFYSPAVRSVTIS